MPYLLPSTHNLTHTVRKRMSFKENCSVAFHQLLADVETNIDSLEKCSELFENFLSQVATSPSITEERIELAILLLCVGRYQESYNIIRRIERSVAAAPDPPAVSGQDSSQEFWWGKSAPSSSHSGAASEDEDVLEEVEWLLPQPNQPATSPYQWLYIGQIFL